MDNQITNASEALKALAEELQIEKQCNYPNADKNCQQAVAIVETLKDKLDEAGFLFGECADCGAWFINSASMPVFSVGDGEYLCAACHAKRFPTDRAWDEYIVKNWQPASVDDDTYNQMLANDFANVSDERLGKLGQESASDPDCPIYYTES